MPDGEGGSASSAFTPYTSNKSVMTDAPFNPGQRGNLNFEGIPVNEDIGGDFPLDYSVIESFPPKTKVISANRFGSSEWTVIARVDVELEDGEPKTYFLKCAEEDTGKAMMEGEFHSMTALYDALPGFFPEPYAWGRFSQNIGQSTYFFLSNFIEMSNDIPDPTELCRNIAELHKRSVSPTGMFGFHTTTCQGNLPQATNFWDPSWESYFRKMLTNAMNLNTEINGPWKDLEEVTEKVKTIVLPKLLRPLESSGRSIKPSLIHGDLWDGNVGTSYKTGKIYAFDAGAYYAHHEMEVSMWRGEVNKVLRDKVYLKEYLSNIGASEPVDQFDDRNRLYNSYMTLHVSACHGGGFFRESSYNNFTYLINKYQ
ncbi:hypothetical protein VE03_09746 [Pseudogymnoascus sp. 23342-1-I1]|nr:hypothetical protein VE03_09746 [Pseudogymnoascus sp. 23342-1-I1]